jgi:Protein of unknown function (DUF2490)
MRTNSVSESINPGGLFGGRRFFRLKWAMSARLLTRVLVALLMTIPGARIAAQQTENEVSPEVDAHIQLQSSFRVLTFVGFEQAVDYPFQQWYAAAGLGRQFKPILGPHRKNIDPDKEHYFLLGGGYEYLRTTNLGKVTHEDRITLDATFSARPQARLLLQDRNWIELRWIDGKYSTTYRNMVSGEYDLRLHGIRFTPYGTVEAFYDGGEKHSWDQIWYTAGAQWPYKRIFKLETYYRREQCSTCIPKNWNEGAISLHFFFANKE